MPDPPTAPGGAALCPASHPHPDNPWCCRLPTSHDGPHINDRGDQWTDPPTPQQVVDALRAAGFARAGGRDGAYARMNWPEHTDRGTELVPLDPNMADYDDLMGGLLRGLEDAVAAGEVARRVLDGLANPEALTAKPAAEVEPPW